MLLAPTEGSLPYIGKVEKLWVDGGGKVKVRCRWFYRPHEAKGGRRAVSLKTNLHKLLGPLILNGCANQSHFLQCTGQSKEVHIRGSKYGIRWGLSYVLEEQRLDKLV